jgi:hypothetical protein
MKNAQLYLFEPELCEEELAGVEGDGLCEGEEVYEGELAEEIWEGWNAADRSVVAGRGRTIRRLAV